MKTLSFALNPDLNTSCQMGEKLTNLWEALKFGIIGYFIFILLLFTDHMLSTLLDYQSIIKDTSNKFDSYLIKHDSVKLALLGIGLIPLIEEIAFRGFLNFRKPYIAVSLGCATYIILSTFFSFPFNLAQNRMLTIGVGLLALSVTFLLINDKLLDGLRKNFKLLFYVSNILFVFLHISNYKLQEFGAANYLALPIVLIPQAIASFNFSYIRIRNGLKWSIVLHSFYNFIFYLPLLIKLSS